MRIADNIEMLEVGGGMGGGGTVYLTLAWDEDSLVLFDAGFPGQKESIIKAIGDAGRDARKLTHIILTHQDMDHVGCVKDMLALAPSAKVLMHEEEAPYLDGRKTPVKLAAMLADYDNLPPDRKKFCDMLKAGMANFLIKIDQTLTDGEALPMCGGIEVVHTPGHTPGHICLFLKESGVLVAGDALNIADGKVAGPNPQHTYDMEQGLKSEQKVRALPLRGVIAYHGGFARIAPRS